MDAVVTDCRPTRASQDEATRSRVHTTLLPFLKLRSPRPDSIKFITDFSRRTGDLEVLSKPDIHLLALCYELEVESNGGDWRLRRTPAQKGLNGNPPAAEEKATTSIVDGKKQEPYVEAGPSDQNALSDAAEAGNKLSATPGSEPVGSRPQPTVTEVTEAEVEAKMKKLDLDEGQHESSQQATFTAEPVQDDAEEAGEEEEDDDDDDGWITPSNLKKHQAKDASVAAPSEAIQETLQAALLTSDFAMQNVALRINLKFVTLV